MLWLKAVTGFQRLSSTCVLGDLPQGTEQHCKYIFCVYFIIANKVLFKAQPFSAFELMDKDIKATEGEIKGLGSDTILGVRTSNEWGTLILNSEALGWGTLNKATHVPCLQKTDGVPFVSSFLLVHTEDGTQGLVNEMQALNHCPNVLALRIFWQKLPRPGCLHTSFLFLTSVYPL